MKKYLLLIILTNITTNLIASNSSNTNWTLGGIVARCIATYTGDNALTQAIASPQNQLIAGLGLCCLHLWRDQCRLAEVLQQQQQTLTEHDQKHQTTKKHIAVLTNELGNLALKQQTNQKIAQQNKTKAQAPMLSKVPVTSSSAISTAALWTQQQQSQAYNHQKNNK